MNWNDMVASAPSRIENIDSSNLGSILFYGGSAPNDNLIVRFKNGSVYGYKHVPTVAYLALLGGMPTKDGKPFSIGAAFHSVIKKGGYEYERIEIE